MMLRPAVLLIPAQGLAMLALLAGWPPASGRMMMVSLTTSDRTVAAAIGGDVRLIGPGPLPGSMIVAGDRSAVRQRAGWSVLVTAAPPSGCGDEAGGIAT